MDLDQLSTGSFEYRSAEHGAELDGQALAAITEYSDLLPDAHDFPNTVLTAAGYKNGAMLDVAASHWEEIYAFADVLTETGTHCVIDTEKDADTNIYAHVLLTRKPMVETEEERSPHHEYSAEELRALFDGRNYGDPHVEREKGAFLGYPEDATEAVLYWGRIQDDDMDTAAEQRQTISGTDFADRFSTMYGLSEQEQDQLRFLSNYSDAPTTRAFERLFRTVNIRYNVLSSLEELYGVMLTDFDEYW